jgi:hypothetical protein
MPSDLDLLPLVSLFYVSILFLAPSLNIQFPQNFKIRGRFGATIIDFYFKFWREV